MRKGFTVLLMAFYVFFTPHLTSAQLQTVGLFTKNTGEQDGYVLFSPNESKYTYLIDKCGKLVHKWYTGDIPGLDAYILPNGNLLSTGNISNPYFNSSGSLGGLLQTFTWDGKLTWSYAISDSITQQDHDVYPLPNGNILVCEWERFTAAQAIAAGRNPALLNGVPVWSIKIQEVKPVGGGSIDTVWQWRIWDHLVQDYDSTKANYGVVADHPELLNINYEDSAALSGNSDWTHGNAVTYNPDLDQVMISSRNMSEIYIIDHSTSTSEAASHSGGKHNKGGDFLYRWGNPYAYHRGKKSDQKLFAQHNPSWIPDGYPGAGNITIFNDGVGRPQGNYSSADIIKPPVDSNGNYKLDSGAAYGPDTAYWSYVASPYPTSFYSDVQGGVQKLLNGNVLIDNATSGDFFEVDSNKNLVWRYVCPVNAKGPVIQDYNPGDNTCFRANLYMENFPGFNNITLKPLDPIEFDPNYYNCYMPYVIYPTPLYHIAQLKGYNPFTGIADSLNAGIGFIKGVVESQDLGANATQFTLIDSTGAITITADQVSYSPTIGDSVLIGGIVAQSDGLIEYSSDTIILKPKGTWQKQPDVVTQLGESYQSDLITIKNARLTDTLEWNGTGEGFNAHITNGKDTFVMYVNSRTNLFNTPVLNEEFNVTGIEIQDKPSSPYFGNYQIEPRGIFDIEKVTQLYKIRQVRIQDAVTGVADSAGSSNEFYLKGIVQSPDFSANGLNFSIKDSSGSIIVVAATDIDGYGPTVGDSIILRGLLTQVNGLIEVKADSIYLLKNASPIIKPVLVSKLTETTEAQLVKLDGYYLTDTSQWVPKGDGFGVTITNGTDTFVMYINSTTNLFNAKALQVPFDVTGIEIQNQPKSPYFGNYEIEPRGFYDIERYVELYKIRQVRVQDPVTGVADSADGTNDFYLKGIVQSPDFSTTGLNFSLKDSTGSIIAVAATGIDGYTPAIGDSIELRGTIIQVNGLTEVKTDSISLLKNASPAIKPFIVSSLSENYEAQLVKLNGYYLTDTSQWKPNGDGFGVNITNGTDTFVMYVSSATNLFDIKELPSPFDVTGIEIQDQTKSPYFGNYQIEPRGVFDIERDVQLYKIRQVRVQDALTGIADSSGSKNNFYLKGIVQSPDFSSTGLNFSLIDSTGAIIVVSNTDVNGFLPNIGDSIELRGLVIQVGGLTEVVTDSISILKNASPVLKPITVPNLAESYEAQLVRLNGYYLADTSQWIAIGDGFDVNITNGTDTTIMHISSTTDLFSMPPLEGPFNVIGIEIQDQPAAPYFGGYEIEPRGLFDIERYTQLYRIRQVRVQDTLTGMADSAGSLHPFLLKGIVQSPDFITSGYEFSIKDSTGSIFVEAINVVNSYTPTVGDSVEIRGILTQVNGLTSVVIDSISKLANASPILVPATMAALSETTEAKLVKYNNAWLINPSQWVASGQGFNADITNGSDTIQLYISSATNTFTRPAPKGKFNVTGIGFQNKASAPYFGGYQLLPRDFGDFQFFPYNLYKIREVKGNNPVSGIADSINTYCLLKGIIQSENLSGNNSEFYSLQDSTGAITVTSSSLVDGYSPVVGDSVELRGTVLQFNGLTHFAVDSVSKISSGIQIPPVIVTSLDENTESGLVTINGYALVDSTKWDTTGANGSFEVKATNTTDTISLKIVSGTDLYNNTSKPPHNFNVTGIGSQDDPTSPYFSDYYLIPRNISDFAHNSGIAPQNLLNGQIEVYPNPASESIYITAGFNITEIQVTDMVGKVLYSQIAVAAKTSKVDLSSFEQGIYLVKVYNGSSYGITKIVKE